MNQNTKKAPFTSQSFLAGMGHWALIDLTVVTFGGLLIVAILTPFFKQNSGPIGFVFAGFVSGLLVGFLPYFEDMLENPEIKRLLPWIKLFTTVLTIVLLAFTLFNALITRSLLLVLIWFLPGTLLSFVVTRITRPVCDRMLVYDAKWWMWPLATLGVILSTAVIGILAFWMASR
jgi:hypothetical protein